MKSYLTILTDSLSVKVVALFQMFKATFIESHVEIPSIYKAGRESTPYW
jgi:hypothetical protein